MSGSDHVYGRKVDKTGRSTGKFASSKTRKGHGPIDDQFLWLGRRMLDSPAMKAVSGPALKILMRIGLEHLAHGGAGNGHLPVTYQNFRAEGVAKSTIALALAELIALGFIERTDAGRMGWGEDKGRPSTYRLTWLGTAERSKPTNEWQRHKSVEDAEKAVVEARAAVQGKRKAKRDAVAPPQPAPKALAG